MAIFFHPNTANKLIKDNKQKQIGSMANRTKDLYLTEEDLAAIELKASRGAHNLMMGNSSVRGGARKSKKAYSRKNFRKNDWD